MILNEKYKLLNGVEIPKIALGTWFIKDDEVSEVIKKAVEVGYRSIDTAQAYGNERGVGEGVVNCGIPRKELFVTSKIAAEAKSYESAKKAIEDILSKTKLDYLDLIIVHSPQPWAEWRDPAKRYFEENIKVWRALEEAYKDGKVRSIGVSNFLIDDLQNILDHCEIKPMVNQILNHIGATPDDLIDFCQKNDILIESYSPLGHGNAVADEKVTELAKKYGVSPAQICMKYVLEMGTVAIPKATSREHLLDNAKVDFEISEEDLKSLRDVRFKGYGEMKKMPVFSGK